MPNGVCVREKAGLVTVFSKLASDMDPLYTLIPRIKLPGFSAVPVTALTTAACKSTLPIVMAEEAPALMSMPYASRPEPALTVLLTGEADKTTVKEPSSPAEHIVEVPVPVVPVPPVVPVVPLSIVVNFALVEDPTKPVPAVKPRGVKMVAAYKPWKATTAALVKEPKYIVSFPVEPEPEAATCVAAFWFNNACKHLTSVPVAPCERFLVNVIPEHAAGAPVEVPINAANCAFNAAI